MGIFTTLRVRDGHVRFWDDHLRRVREGAAALGLAAPPRDLAGQVAAAVGGLSDARVRISGEHGAAWRVEAAPYRAPDAAWVLCPVALGAAGPGPFRKRTERDTYDRARRAAGDADDALLESSDGRFWECTTGNIFWELPGGRLVTPPAGGPLLPGITRRRLLAALREAGEEAAEVGVGRPDAARATGCAVTNALVGVHAVAGIAGVGRYPGAEALARRLGELLDRADAGFRIIQ